MHADWEDGIGVKGLWTYTQTGPSKLFDRQSHRNNEMWDRIILARRPLIAAALAWRDAAVADGWSMRPTYDHEDVSRAWKLTKEGFVAQGISRPANCEPGAPEQRGDTPGSAEVSVWGPDKLTIPSGRTYSMDALRAGLTTCSMCKGTGVATQRVGFAGRVCATCLPAARAAIETPGWTN